MVFLRGAFVLGQMQMVVNNGKRAEKLLKAGDYENEAEREALEVQVKTGKSWEKALEEKKKELGV